MHFFPILCLAASPFHALNRAGFCLREHTGFYVTVRKCVSAFAYVEGFVYTWIWACPSWASSPRDDVQFPGPHTHSNMLRGCVYKHCTDTQTQRVSKRGIDQWETSLPYGWERAEVKLDANAPLAWSVPETLCTGGQQKRVTLLNSKEPDSRCVLPHAHACTFILVRTSYTPQMLTNIATEFLTLTFTQLLHSVNIGSEIKCLWFDLLMNGKWEMICRVMIRSSC